MFKNDILLMEFMDVMLILLKELPRQVCEAFGNHYHNLIIVLLVLFVGSISLYHCDDLAV